MPHGRCNKFSLEPHILHSVELSLPGIYLSTKHANNQPHLSNNTTAYNNKQSAVLHPHFRHTAPVGLVCFTFSYSLNLFEFPVARLIRLIKIFYSHFHILLTVPLCHKMLLICLTAFEMHPVEIPSICTSLQIC